MYILLGNSLGYIMSYMKREWEKNMVKQILNQCYECESAFEDILDLIAHIREQHKQ